MIKALKLWPKIFKFLSHAIVSEKDAPKYPKRIKQLKNNVKKFYNCGKITFMAKNKSAYLHILRFNMPHISKDLRTRHKMGVGIFNMQGLKKKKTKKQNKMYK